MIIDVNYYYVIMKNQQINVKSSHMHILKGFLVYFPCNVYIMILP